MSCCFFLSYLSLHSVVGGATKNIRTFQSFSIVNKRQANYCLVSTEQFGSVRFSSVQFGSARYTFLLHFHCQSCKWHLKKGTVLYCASLVIPGLAYQPELSRSVPSADWSALRPSLYWRPATFSQTEPVYFV